MPENWAIAAGCLVVLLSIFYFLYVSDGRGILWWKRYLTATIYIHLYRYKHKKKLCFQNLRKSVSPINVGIIYSTLEFDIENPSKGIIKHCDGIHFLGIDFEENFIDVCINKVQDEMATVWVFLKLSNGEMYKLPFTQDTRKSYIDNESYFHSSGLQIRCLGPLRKWRISFNGLLQKCKSHLHPLQSEENEELVHVKFSFVWLAMSVVQELNIDFRYKDLAQAFADCSHDIDNNDLHEFQKLHNKYEQWGQLMGTLSVKGEDEKELYLWSAKTRILDNPVWNEDISAERIYMYLKGGSPFKIENMSASNFFSNYTSGYTVTGHGGIKCLSGFNYDSMFKDKFASKLQFSFYVNGKRKKVVIEFLGLDETFLVGPELQWSDTLKMFKCVMDDIEGFGIFHFIRRSNNGSSYIFEGAPVLLKDPGYSYNAKFVLPLTHDHCKSVSIAGGKGSSLALLNSLVKQKSVFTVPKGFVITTAAFENHIKSNSGINFTIQKLTNVSCGKENGDLKEECLKCVKEFQTMRLSEKLKEDIQNMLLSLYKSFHGVRFSVRSSACGEDSEDLSAAGQMLTVLGIRGLNNILDSVVKCWSSKYGFEAVQYARQNGQPINAPMAVVVQEMVPAEFSGVMFTVHPVTGDPSHPYITANYGLGETVVSSLAEPDTIILERNRDNSLSVVKKIIGSKKAQVYLKAEQGTEQKILITESDSSCLNDEWAVRIGNIGILVETCFCTPRDIEWAVCNNELFLLQARPVTTLHKETDFELIHDQDSPVRSHDEYWTRANTGEVFLGALSPLGISLVVGTMDTYAHRSEVLRERPLTEFCPYFHHILPVTHKQITLSIIDTLFRKNRAEVSTFQRSFEISLFGRIVGTEDMHKAGIRKYGYVSKHQAVLGYIYIITAFFKTSRSIKKCDEHIRKFKLPLETFTTTANTWEGILNQMKSYSEVCAVHGLATFLSSFLNLMVMTIVAKGKVEWDAELYCDFANLMSSCSGIESADVPESLQELAKTIALSHGTKFSSLPVDIALNVISNDSGAAGKLFNQFLTKHGHRCVKEFDLYSVSWRMKPESLIPTLQNLVSCPNIVNVQPKQFVSTEEAISKLKTPLTKTTRKVLKFLLPWSRQAVVQREKTKSMLIKSVDWLRQSCHRLGKLMLQEGMLPDSELIFFLTTAEIQEILFTRRPGLVLKALRRKHLHPKLDVLQFPEIIKGIPKPVQEEEDYSNYETSFTLTGTPVCQGKVKAIAKVVTSLHEACTIKNGDILITHSTDIGWSPYFPLLSGVVTVLGGLISHGAVVAREYGLPCVVGVQKATSAFKSGDFVILDGTRGTVTKIAEYDLEQDF